MAYQSKKDTLVFIKEEKTPHPTGTPLEKRGMNSPMPRLERSWKEEKTPHPTGTPLKKRKKHPTLRAPLLKRGEVGTLILHN